MYSNGQPSHRATSTPRGGTSSIPAAMAIIHQDDKYLMQLRDDIPNIVYPGVWGFFGGHLKSQENPEMGLKRELIEKINYSL